MHRIRLTSVLLFLSLIHLSAGQLPEETAHKVDSLRSMIDTTTVDSVKYKYFNDLIDELEKVDRSATIGPAKERLQLAKDMDDADRIGRSAENLGSQYLFLGNTDSALVYSIMAQEILMELEDLQGMNSNLNNLALLYQRDNQYEEAVSAYQQVIVFSDSLDDPIGVIYAQVNLMSLFIDLDDFERALEYFSDIEETIENIDPENESAQSELNNISSAIYLNVGQCYDELNKPDSAMIYFQIANDHLSKIEYEYGRTIYKGYIDNSIGDVIYKLSQQADREDSTKALLYEALQYYREANEAFVSIEDSRGTTFTLNNLGKVRNNLGQYDIARSDLINALKLAEEIDFREQIRDSYEHLSKNAESTGNYDQANGYLRTWVAYRDSIRNEERVKLTRGLEVRFETAQKEKEISELEFQNKLSAQQQTIQKYIFFTSILLLLGAVYMVYSRLRLKKQKEIAAFEKSVNQAMSRFVPMDFIKAIGRDKITDVQLGDQIEKEVTVVFTDIRSFTTISEGMTPQENFAFVKEYAERMGPIIERNHGFVSQYLGDGIMAIFQRNPGDALNACIQMQEDIIKYNELLKSRGRQPIKVGMGMHTGPLIMGIIGDETRRDATLISDTVNSAARIESTTKSLKADILLSEQSVEKLANPSDYNLTPMGAVSVKGKNIPIQVYNCAISDNSVNAIEVSLNTNNN